MTTPLPPLSHLQWRAPEWISAFGPLTRSILMDYFVLSPFFDKSSNNASLRMQMMFSRGGMQGVDEEGELKRFRGIEYVLVHDDAPGLFIVHKRWRENPNQGYCEPIAQTIAAYHILNDSIYEAPSLYQVVNERLLTSVHALSSSLSLLITNKPKWNPSTLNNWKILESSSTNSDSIEPTKKEVLPLEGESEGGTADAAMKDEKLDDEDLLIRPSEQFNPLLFRALSTVSKTLPSIPEPIEIIEEPAKETQESLVKAGDEVEAKKEEKGEGGTAAATGTSGKRIPRKALQNKKNEA